MLFLTRGYEKSMTEKNLKNHHRNMTTILCCFIISNLRRSSSLEIFHKL